MRFIARRAGVDIPVEVERAGNGYRVKIGDRWMDADLVDAGPYLRSLRLEDGTQFSFAHHREGITHEISMQAATVHVDIIDPLSLKRRRREDEDKRRREVAEEHGRRHRVHAQTVGDQPADEPPPRVADAEEDHGGGADPGGQVVGPGCTRHVDRRVRAQEWRQQDQETAGPDPPAPEEAEHAGWSRL